MTSESLYEVLGCCAAAGTIAVSRAIVISGCRMADSIRARRIPSTLAFGKLLAPMRIFLTAPARREPLQIRGCEEVASPGRKHGPRRVFARLLQDSSSRQSRCLSRRLRPYGTSRLHGAN